MDLLSSISIEVATLGAAIIAAIASIVALIASLFAARAAESRAAQREILAPYLGDLSEVVYSTIACSKILMKAKTEPAIKNWRQRASSAQESLKSISVKLRYPLWGITDAMSTLTRLPDWIEHARPLNLGYDKKLFAKGRNLGHWIDKSVRWAYSNGKPPNIPHRLFVRYHNWQLLRTYENMKSKKEESHLTSPR